MIIQLVQSILDVPEFANDGMSQLAELFQEGQPIEDILPLLSSTNNELILAGTWLVTQIKRPIPETLKNKLVDLMSHSSKMVRNQARAALESIEVKENRKEPRKSPGVQKLRVQNLYGTSRFAPLAANSQITDDHNHHILGTAANN